LIDILWREVIYLSYFFSVQFSQIVVYWAIGILIGSTISVFGKERIHKSIQTLHKKNMGVLGIVPACAIGIASPLCMYGTVPIVASFSQKGVKDAWLAAFMMGSILLNPQLIMYSAALGPVALSIRIISCLICGIAAGLCVHFFYARRNKDFFKFSGFAEPENRDIDPNRLIRLLKNIWRNIKITAPFLLIGVLLSAMFQRYVPEDIVVRMFGNNRGFGVLMAASIGVPMYVCGGGTIPLLQYWLGGGMSMGSATAFMITGPATKITNLGALKIVLGMKNFVLYLLFSIAFALIAGLLVDLVI